jgi:hypothetical protein
MAVSLQHDNRRFSDLLALGSCYALDVLRKWRIEIDLAGRIGADRELFHVHDFVGDT